VPRVLAEGPDIFEMQTYFCAAPPVPNGGGKIVQAIMLWPRAATATGYPQARGATSGFLLTWRATPFAWGMRGSSFRRAFRAGCKWFPARVPDPTKVRRRKTGATERFLLW
jgi:hypothetical protein